MKGILKVFTNDVKSISKRGIAVIIIFGLIGVYFAIGILKDADEEEGAN